MPRYGDYEGARLQGRLWTPEAVRPNLRLWLDADRPETLTLVSGDVSQWDDLSGRGLHATQGTSGFRPTWNGPGGGVRFTASSNDVLVGSTLWSGSLGEFCVVILASSVSLTNGVLFSLNDAGNSSGRVLAHAPWSDGNVYWDAGSASTPERVSAAWGGALSTPQLWTFVSSAARGAQYLSRDGTTLASDSSGASVTNSTGYTVGGFSTSGHDGVVYEMIFLDATDDPTARRAEGAIWWKWRRWLPTLGPLAAGHPYRNSPPLLGM